MSTPPPVVVPMPQHVDIPCCSPATTESVAVVRDKVADARADVLVGQGAILRGQGDSTSAILRDANGNALALNSAIDRSALGVMSQVDKYGLANLQSTQAEADRVSSDVHSESDKITGQASTIAWNQAGIQNAGFAESRAQVERINDAQSAYSDRAFKHLQGQTSDSFARLSAQGENGFYRTGVAIAATDKQVVQSEISLGKSVAAGFSDVLASQRDSYARLSEQNCDLKLLTSQGFGAVQLEAAKNTAAVQLQAAVNHKEGLLEQSKWFALAEKTAMVNKCELEAKLAACCCEIKETVTGTAHATQSLIQAGERERVRDALAAATTENAILKLRREEHHHYPPYWHHGRSRRGSRSD